MQKDRPLSPHLQVYKPQLTSMLSVLHRGTGIFLFFGTPLLVFLLWSIAEGAESYSAMQTLMAHPIAKLALFGWVFSMFYHLCNGIRHLFWDIGRGYELDSVYTSGKLVLVASLLMTAVTVYLAVAKTGGI